MISKGLMWMQIAGIAERRHVYGVFATFTGLGVSLLAWLKVISIVAGAGGAVFGLVAGFFTMKSAIRNYHNGK